MKTYTQADFNALTREENGYLHIPSGDWTGVDFGGQDKLIFGDCCKLGGGCTLGDWCTLGNGCKLGDWCMLGDWCTLGNGCKLGDCCKLGDWCTLGNGCKLGDDCTLENGRVEHATFFFVSDIGSENRTAYAYCNTQTGEIFVRAGCWFSDLLAFIERVKGVHGGTQHETDYLAFVAFAKARFARYLTEASADE